MLGVQQLCEILMFRFSKTLCPSVSLLQPMALHDFLTHVCLLMKLELAAVQYDVKARKSAVIDAAEAHAIWTHHDQVARGGNV